MAYRFSTRTISVLGLLGAALGTALAAGPLAADVKRGVDAWSTGDYDAAVNEWQLPAKEGDADALFNLAQAYRLGRGVTADITRARELYAEAAQKGHVKAADNYGLLLFQQGEQKTAMPLIRAAADRGDPRAQYVLGLAHFNADYAERDWVRAYALLTLSQASGLPQASGALAQMDSYIPLEQRQQAQQLAREIEAEAGKRRAAQLAAADLGTPSAAPAPVATPVAASTPAPVRVAQAAPAASPPATQSTSARYSEAASPQAAPPAAPPAPVRVAAPAAPVMTGPWGVQLGAFGVAANAERLWSRLSDNPALAGTSKALVSGGNVTRLRAVGFASRADAARACDRLKAQGQACLIANP